MARSRAAEKRVNLAVARIIPPVLFGVIIYASYDLTKQLCIDYLIHPSTKYSRHARVGIGAAILVIYYILLIPMVVSYLRLLQKVLWSPDYLPRGEKPARDQKDSRPSHRRRKRRRSEHESNKVRDAEKGDDFDSDVERGGSLHSGGKAFPLDAVGLESFYTKDVFVCQRDGRPPYCSKCSQFKTDRAHHCREVDRCVRKMDHFCPWVGGVVAESSFKFFIQFLVYTAMFCIFCLVVFAYFLAEAKRETGRVNAHWAVGIGLSGLFGLFSCGMTLSSLQLALQNLSTIEHIDHRATIWTLAIRVPDHLLNATESQWAPTFRTITYPLQSLSPPAEAEPGPGPGQQEDSLKPDAERRVFAILQTRQGENPFDLGSPLKNLQQVMGYSVLDWLLPLRESPCTDHSSEESAFALGPVVSRLKQEAFGE
ncbi:hypothetical protein ASPZODRAFT_130357 [Penicilliopsis zonata CBS 506.65]|uniref:Palmitoyltransferase n=1 Tax=Penicilliopsis zonata CBS 506.65 TaxID=1073090 RepID=A0A1L9SMA1_9EURO|nr:hypothetical protein ASPZODRAFT_130357 [Penicilliopsis zonata CBS 506.65]OJJ48355.1 hypothetical protein ASPZODRAFT_130357 [Penicilliopsis zonata CBS 506.65]